MPLFKIFNRSRPSQAAPKAPAAAAPPPARRRPAAPRAAAAAPAANVAPVEVQASAANAVTVAAVQQRLGQVREDLVQPIREVLDNAWSEDMSNILEMLLSEAATGMEQLQQQVEVCVAEERFDVLEEISSLASDFQELQRGAERWKEGVAGTSSAASQYIDFARMTAQQQEEAQEAWLRQEDERRQQEEALLKEQEEAQQRWLEEQAELRRQEAARQEEEARRAHEEAEREMRQAAEEQERLAREEAERQMREEEEARIAELEAIRRRVAEEEQSRTPTASQEQELQQEAVPVPLDLQVEDLDEEEPLPGPIPRIAVTPPARPAEPEPVEVHRGDTEVHSMSHGVTEAAGEPKNLSPEPVRTAEPPVIQAQSDHRPTEPTEPARTTEPTLEVRRRSSLSEISEHIEEGSEDTFPTVQFDPPWVDLGTEEAVHSALQHQVAPDPGDRQTEEPAPRTTEPIVEVRLVESSSESSESHVSEDVPVRRRIDLPDEASTETLEVPQVAGVASVAVGEAHPAEPSRTTEPVVEVHPVDSATETSDTSRAEAAGDGRSAEPARTVAPEVRPLDSATETQTSAAEADAEPVGRAVPTRTAAPVVEVRPVDSATESSDHEKDGRAGAGEERSASAAVAASPGSDSSQQKQDSVDLPPSGVGADHGSTFFLETEPPRSLSQRELLAEEPWNTLKASGWAEDVRQRSPKENESRQETPSAFKASGWAEDVRQRSPDENESRHETPSAFKASGWAEDVRQRSPEENESRHETPSAFKASGWAEDVQQRSPDENESRHETPSAFKASGWAEDVRQRSPEENESHETPSAFKASGWAEDVRQRSPEENESRHETPPAFKASGWAEDVRQRSPEENESHHETPSAFKDIFDAESRRSSFMAEAVEDSWRSALKALSQDATAARPSVSDSPDSDASQRHRAATRFVEAALKDRATSSKGPSVSQGITGAVFQPSRPDPKAAPAAAPVSASPKPLARPTTEADRLELERSTRKALEDAQFWDLPIEEALRSLRARSAARCKDATRVALAFEARRGGRAAKRQRERSAPAAVREPRDVATTAPWHGEALRWDASPAKKPKAQPAKSGQVASIQIKQPIGPEIDKDAFSAQFIQAAARAAGVDPRRLRVRAVRTVPPPPAPVAPMPAMPGRKGAPVALGPHRPGV